MCEVAGNVYGVVTSPMVHLRGAMSSVDVQRHSLLTGIQRCFLSEEFGAEMGIPEVDLDAVFDAVFDDLGTARFGADALLINGMDVPCSSITYRDVVFTGPTDPDRWPVTVARSVATRGPWPPLVEASSMGDG